MATANHFSTELSIRIPRNFNGTLSDQLARAIAELTKAAEYAERTSTDRWDFAVEIQQLRELGLCNNDLRYLIKLHYVEHAAEVRNASSKSRRFRREADLSITSKSCFVLSQSKCDAVSDEGSVTVSAPIVAKTHVTPGIHDSSQLPFWDVARRVLEFHDKIVKHFKWQAANQEIILSAFQEEGWPARIDDPLHPLPMLAEKRRLSDSIRSLNRNQLHSLIHFRGDGSGQGIVWDALE
jgi:hypothetical protein